MEFSSITFIKSIYSFLLLFHSLTLELDIFFILTFPRFETYDTSTHPPQKLGKRARIAATSALNVNVSAAGLKTFIWASLSWRRQLELEEKAIKLNEVLLWELIC